MVRPLLGDPVQGGGYIDGVKLCSKAVDNLQNLPAFPCSGDALVDLCWVDPALHWPASLLWDRSNVGRASKGTSVSCAVWIDVLGVGKAVKLALAVLLSTLLRTGCFQAAEDAGRRRRSGEECPVLALIKEAVLSLSLHLYSRTGRQAIEVL